MLVILVSVLEKYCIKRKGNYIWPVCYLDIVKVFPKFLVMKMYIYIQDPVAKSEKSLQLREFYLLCNFFSGLWVVVDAVLCRKVCLAHVNRIPAILSQALKKGNPKRWLLKNCDGSSKNCSANFCSTTSSIVIFMLMQSSYPNLRMWKQKEKYWLV